VERRRGEKKEEVVDVRIINDEWKDSCRTKQTGQ
jgi:hypothetical protein